MRIFTRFLITHLLGTLLLALWLAAPALAGPPPPAASRPLAEALNPDGTLKPGANGSFDARQFRMGTAPDGRPVFRPTGTAGAGDERWQSGFGVPNGTDGTVLAVAQAGTTVYIGGGFAAVGNVAANGVAKWDGTAWSSLGTAAANGVNYTVYALAADGNGNVYAGGAFTQAGGVAANYVAKWNGTAWSSLGTGTANGVAGYVYALAVAGNGDVYAGGSFTQAGGTAANRVVKWNGTAWNSLGTGTANGVNNTARALALDGNGNVYVGGEFTQAGGAVASGVAKWNGTAWSNLGTGTFGNVMALAVASNGDVYVGGSFTQAGGVAADKTAKWNGTAWSPLGTTSGVYSSVNAIAVAPNGDVYVGGNSGQSTGTSVPVSRWNGTAWTTTGAVRPFGTSNANALTVAANGEVYVGGRFEQVDGAWTDNLARWNGTAWSSLGTANGISGVNTDGVNAVAVAPNGDVYAGGYFTQAGGVAANYVAKWNGTAWSSLGTGSANGVNLPVFALAVNSIGELYVGGWFTQAGGAAANYIAKWNGTAWSSLGIGTGTYNYVYALAVAANGDVYAGGLLRLSGGGVGNNIAKWNGTTWSSLGTGTANGVDGVVYALATAPNGDIYVGGGFTQAGGAAAAYVAKWNGTAWSPLGSGMGSGEVRALAITSNGDVYAGGYFTQAGGAVANCVAKWNGTAWSTLGTGTAIGVSGGVFALAAASNGDVYVGGGFGLAGGLTTNRIAKWNGTAWSSLGTGVNNVGAVRGLGIGPTGKLYVGGGFTATGDGSKAMSRFAVYDPNAPLAAAAAKAAPAAQLYPNPAHATATLRLPAPAPRQPLTLLDALGRVVRRFPAPATAEAALDLRGLPAGTYLVRCGEYAQRLVVE